MAEDKISLAPIREQGREARKLTDDENDPNVFTPQDCPYGPGELRDAWQAGFGGAKEEVGQVDTSEPTTEDVRSETVRTVREGGKGKGRSGKRRGSKGKAEKAADQPSKVETKLTGNAETSLVTESGPADPEASAVPNLTTKLGDPAGGEGDRTQLGGPDDSDDKKNLM